MFHSDALVEDSYHKRGTLILSPYMMRRGDASMATRERVYMGRYSEKNTAKHHEISRIAPALFLFFFDRSKVINFFRNRIQLASSSAWDVQS